MIDRVTASDGNPCSSSIRVRIEIYTEVPSLAVTNAVPRGTVSQVSQPVDAVTMLSLSVPHQPVDPNNADLIAIAQGMRAQCPLLLAGASLRRLRDDNDPHMRVQPRGLLEPFRRADGHC